MLPHKQGKTVKIIEIITRKNRFKIRLDGNVLK